MKNEQELFDEIGKVLHAHEGAYPPGAWEGFVKSRKRRRGLVYLRIAAAAAVLLIIGYAAWLFMPVKPLDNDQPQTNNTQKPPYIYQKNGQATDSEASDQAVASLKKADERVSQRTTSLKVPAAIEKSANNEDSAPVAVAPYSDQVVPELKTEEIATIPAVTKPQDVPAPKTEIENNEPLPAMAAAPRRYNRGTQRLNYDSLANLNKPVPTSVENKKNKAFSYALMVSPSVGNQKMNFGTGVEVAYNINKNFSVSSGVTYANLNGGSNRGAVPAEGRKADLQGYNATFASPSLASSFSTSSTRSVQRVQLALSGVELPLNFQYKTNKGFYISAGLSAMSVIGNNISYDYLDSRTISTPSSKGFSPTISVITEKTTEQSTEAINGFIGFYTLSAGKKINFGKGKLNFAPFIKVPFNRVSSENLQLMHGGVQLGFGF